MTLQSLRGGAVILVAVGLIAAGCGGDDSSSTSTTSSSTIAPTSTSADASSSVPSSSSSTTASPSTTAAPPPTTLPVEDQVRAAYQASYEAYWVCLRRPADCDPVAQTASQGPARATFTKTVEDLRAGGLHIGQEDPGYVVIESVDVAPGGKSAVVRTCLWDTGVLYGPPAQPGGPEIVVNNLQVSSRFESTMFFEDGTWKVGEEKRLERHEGVNACPPEQ